MKKNERKPKFLGRVIINPIDLNVSTKSLRELVKTIEEKYQDFQEVPEDWKTALKKINKEIQNRGTINNEDFTKMIKEEGWDFIAGSGHIASKEALAQNTYENIDIYSNGRAFMWVERMKDNINHHKFDTLREFLDNFLVGVVKPSIELEAMGD